MMTSRCRHRSYADYRDDLELRPMLHLSQLQQPADDGHSHSYQQQQQHHDPSIITYPKRYVVRGRVGRGGRIVMDR